MKQTGYVLKANEKKVDLRIQRTSACGEACSSCGSSCDDSSILVSMENAVSAKVGDYVEINAKSKSIIKYALIVYMIPFFMLVFGIILGMEFFKSKAFLNFEAYGFLVGLVFLFLSYFIVKKIDKSIEEKDESTMEIIRILNR